jgi:hypothetical protein
LPLEIAQVPGHTSTGRALGRHPNGIGFPHHYLRFDMDERALAPATPLMTALALQYPGESIR